MSDSARFAAVFPFRWLASLVRWHGIDRSNVLRAYLNGCLVVAGPAFDPAYYPDSGGHGAPLEMPTPGIVIFQARDLTEAKRIMESDPAVRAGVFMARLNAFKLSFIRK